MRFAAAASRNQDATAAVQKVVATVNHVLHDAPVDLAVVFVSGHHAKQATTIAAQVRRALRPRLLLGCTAQGVLGAGQEIESGAGVSLLVAQMPNVTLTPLSLAPDQYAFFDALLEGKAAPDWKALVVLADPFTTPVRDLLAGFHERHPQVPVIGGLASAAKQAGDNGLFLDDEAFTTGLVGVGIGGAVRVETVVSQGCLPVGPPLRVTGARHNKIQTLRFRPALEMTQTVLVELPEEEQALLESGLYVGVVIDEYKAAFERGDFLVHNVVGADEETGALHITEPVRPGQTIQFHVRDEATADEDLRLLLERVGHAGVPKGALLFSCNGRGTNLFSFPGHDVKAVEAALPGLPAAGFFASGEIGPVGGKPFVHGHTASIAFFYPE